MKEMTSILDNQKEVLAFLKSRFPFYHQSNFFLRDVQFGIRALLEKKGMKIGYTAAEAIARAFTLQLERAGIFIRVDQQTWVVNYPEFKKPAVKPPAAKPAGPAAAAPRPAARAVPPAAVPSNDPAAG
jgi:hypothetical protein